MTGPVPDGEVPGLEWACRMPGHWWTGALDGHVVAEVIRRKDRPGWEARAGLYRKHGGLTRVGAQRVAARLAVEAARANPGGAEYAAWARWLRQNPPA